MPRRGSFPRPRPFLGYTGAKYCHRQTPGNAITSTYRHRQALGNAFRGHLAVAERPRAHCEHTLLCAGLRGIQFAGICCHARPPDGAPQQHIASKATLRLRKGQHARSRRTPPEPIRGMQRCPAAAVGAAAMKEPAGALARTACWRRGRGIDARGLPGAKEGHRRAPSAGCGGSLTHGPLGARAIGCWLATRRSVVTAWARDLLGRGRAAATRACIRTAALSAHQTHRGCCKHALRRGGAASFARAVR